MKILAIERGVEGVTDDRYEPFLREEAARVWDLYQAGIIREAHFRTDREEAVLTLECTDEEEAERILATLPLVKQQLIAFDIVPLRPYPGLARLFA